MKTRKQHTHTHILVVSCLVLTKKLILAASLVVTWVYPFLFYLLLKIFRVVLSSVLSLTHSGVPVRHRLSTDCNFEFTSLQLSLSLSLSCFRKSFQKVFSFCRRRRFGKRRNVSSFIDSIFFYELWMRFCLWLGVCVKLRRGVGDLHAFALL